MTDEECEQSTIYMGQKYKRLLLGIIIKHQSLMSWEWVSYENALLLVQIMEPLPITS